MGATRTFLVALLLYTGQTWGQATMDSPSATNSPPAGIPPQPAPEEDARKWSFSASVYGYIIPDGESCAQPTVAANRDWLHLEARYNYEALETGSAWIGHNFSVGKKLALEFTPMLGGVFGNITGIAPGYEGTLSWWKLELYTEGEYVFDLGDSSASFFYSWSELSLAPAEWFRFGLVVQRTRVYEIDREIQRGLLAGFSYKWVDFTTYVFNPDESQPIVVLALDLNF
jgi:hypothetical protein